jgi:hypothetical protein
MPSGSHGAEGTEVLGHMIASSCGLRSTVTYVVYGKEGLLLVDARSAAHEHSAENIVFCGGEWLERGTNPGKTTNELMLQH